MQFDSVGPFNVDLYPNERHWRAKFWREIEYPAYLEGLERAIGCYVFCVKRDKKTLPWYVGQTTAERGFSGEIFQDSKVLRYKAVPAIKNKYKDAVAQMILFPLVTTKYWKVANNRTPGSRKAIEWLETDLISRAIAINPKLKNVSKTFLLKTMSVRGLIGQQPPGPPTIAARYVRDELFNLQDES